MPVDPQFTAILPRLKAGVAMARALADGSMKREDMPPAPLMGPPTPVDFVEDRVVPSPAGPIPVRIYAPRREAALPLLVYFHGGAFIAGDVDSHDELTRQLANAAACVVVSVSYRLAPAHPFPAAFNDCLAAIEWAVAHAGELGADAARLALAGDSAGGDLAAATALALRDRQGPKLAAQVLIYPGTDLAAAHEGSLAQTGDAYYMSPDDMAYSRASYIAGNDPKNPYISPLRAASLEDLPPAMVIIAEYDLLRDQGKAYARRLAEAGGVVELVEYEGAIHGFLSLPVPMGRQAIVQAGNWLKARFRD